MRICAIDLIFTSWKLSWTYELLEKILGIPVKLDFSVHAYANSEKARINIAF